MIPGLESVEFMTKLQAYPDPFLSYCTAAYASVVEGSIWPIV